MRKSLFAAVSAVACGSLITFGATASAVSTASSAASSSSRELPALEDLGETQLLHSEGVTRDRETGELAYVNSQRGKVTENSGSTLTVRSADGVTWEWTLTDDTRIHVDDDTDAAAADVGTGDTVAVSGTRSGGTREAEHVGDPAPDLSKLGEELEGLEERLKELPELPRVPEDFTGLPERFRAG